MPAKGTMTESAHWRVDIDEDEPERGAFWRGGGAGDKDESRFDPGEPIEINPEHFPIGTVVECRKGNSATPFLTITCRKPRKTKGKPYWEVCYAGYEAMPVVAGECVSLYPSLGSVETYLVVSEPWDEEFYEKLFAERKPQ